jgi:hypothetical protein
MSSSKFKDVDFDALTSGADVKEYPIEDVFGSSPEDVGSSQEYESKEKSGEEEQVLYYFFPAWRSHFFDLIGFLISSIGAIWVSRELTDYVVIVGELFSTQNTQVVLHLPILVLVPGFFLVKTLVGIYDAKYIIDEAGIEAQIGKMSLNFSQPRIRWEDIRGVKPEQTIWERLLDIGTVSVGSAMTQETEIVMKGVPSPRSIQLLIEHERAKRHAEMKQSVSGSRHEYINRD